MLSSSAALATDGYFQDGYGARNKALAGAGVADGRDATAISVNPAGIVDVDDQIAVALTAFSPQRSFSAGAGGPVLPGDHGSDANIFAFPNLGWTHRLSADTVLGIGLAANGGMNTRYHDPVFPFGRAPTGVDLNQMFISAGIAKRFGAFSIGVTPVLAVQTFKARGLQMFDNPMFSSAPGKVTDNSYDFSYGGGVRAGLQYDVTPSLRVAVAGASKMYMTEFNSYAGLFAEQGGFDIPANVTAGLAYDLRPNLTVMFDYKHIFYGDVVSIANRSTNMAQLGADNGPGFGWKDADVFKFGVEWGYSPRLTLRAGYSYNTAVIKPEDVMFNILAPGVVQHHITAGAKYKWSDKIDIEVAGMYAPESTVSGFDIMGAGQPVEIRMHQYEGTVGLVYHFDGTHRELEPFK